MVVYNFKKIAPIPGAVEMIDIILTRTQRKTPTVIHPGYKITRIRNFYMRKVKFTQQSIDEKFSEMLADFPRLDDIHPFYADLMNILYDRDHFKLALGQVNTAKHLIIGISKDYLRLLKYADSLYRCKQLKRAALGRMCTVIKKLTASLGYLEEVRKHISRLPALDPNTRTLLLTGYPNVGKSSFMNKVTRADVEVQPYAFTTKALYVGHMDHRFLRWQVVDTPGILDRPLEERNTIEMQAITALAHLQCCVLYFLDISEQCGYPIDAQLRLFESIRPLFVNKQVMIVANKTDVIPYESLSVKTRQMIEESARNANAELIPMSNISEENIGKLKITACDKLLEARVDAKLSAGRVKDDVLSRITVAIPKPRDTTVRDAYIPSSVLSSQISNDVMKVDNKRTTEKDIMNENGGAGVYSCDYRKYYLLDEDEWKFDTIPQFMDGKNVFDFFDPDIEARLKALEAEEDQLEANGAYAPEEDSDNDLDDEEIILYKAITDKQRTTRKQSHENRGNVPKSLALRGRKTEKQVRDELETKGLKADGLIEHTRGRKRERDQSRTRSNDDAAMLVTDDGSSSDKTKKSPRTLSSSRGRSASVMRDRVRSNSINATRVRAPSATKGPRDTSVAPKDEYQVHKNKRSAERYIKKFAKAGEADREHYPKLVKHLNSGKRSLGTSTIGR